MRRLAAATLAVALMLPGTVFAQPATQPGSGQQPKTQSRIQKGPSAAQQSADKETVYEELTLFDEAFERIRRDAVDPVASTKLVNAALSGMLGGLDPHAAYLDPAAYKAMQAPGAHRSDNLGLVVTMQSGELRVISPRDGSPAAAAGIKPGDIIFDINKQPTFAMTLAQAEERLGGAPGSTVNMTVLRAGKKPMHLTVTRAAYQLHTVEARLTGGNVGYVRIAGFDATTAPAVSAAVQRLRQQAGGKLVGLVLDLRNNPGGSFRQAIATADDFLDRGNVAIIKGRNPAQDKRIAATGSDVAKGLPIVALVNAGTARAAELVAAALHDNKRAVLVGTKTYGDSAIPSLIPLKTGGAIRLTTARFETPNGTDIAKKGIKPDLTVKPVKVKKLASGETLHEVNLPGALKNPNAPQKSPAGAPATASATPAARSATVSAKQMGSKKDAQLSEAVDILRGLAVYNLHSAG